MDITIDRCEFDGEPIPHKIEQRDDCLFVDGDLVARNVTQWTVKDGAVIADGFRVWPKMHLLWLNGPQHVYEGRQLDDRPGCMSPIFKER